MSSLIAKSCQEYGSEAVLVAAFTRAAARELVSRDLPLNDEQVGTLHALCYRALDRPKLVSKSLLADWNAEHPLMLFGGVQTNLDDPYGDFETSGVKDGDYLLQEAGRLRALQVPLSSWPMTVQGFYDQWTDFKANTNTVDFTDLIEQCLTQQASIPHDAAVFFADEAQDFSPLELALVRRWGGQCEQLYIAADDDQAIYKFKGCTPDAFLSPALPPEQVMVLSQSYRVPRAVHAVACRWVEGLSVRQEKLYRPRNAEGVVSTIGMTYQYVDPLYSPLMDWLNAGKTVAILASCSYMLDPIKRQLREWGLPFHNPWRKTRGDWNPLAHRAGTVGAGERVLAYQKVANGQWWTYRDLWHWCAPIRSEQVFAHGAKTAIRKLAEDRVTAESLVAVAELEAWLPDETIAEQATKGSLPWLQQHLLATFEKPLQYACRVIEARGKEALSKPPQIILGTIHSTKGGEADVVVLSPDLSPAGLAEWAQPGEAQDSVRRMFYVGMTRAREELYWMQPVGHSIWGYL